MNAAATLGSAASVNQQHAVPTGLLARTISFSLANDVAADLARVAADATYLDRAIMDGWRTIKASVVHLNDDFLSGKYFVSAEAHASTERIASTSVKALDQDLGLAELVVYLARASALAKSLASAGDHGTPTGLSYATDLAGELNHVLALARASAHTGANGLQTTVNVLRLHRDLARCSSSSLTLATARLCTGALADAHAQMSAIASVLDDTGVRAHSMAVAIERARTSVTPARLGLGRVAPSAARLLTIATSSLPVADRFRYAEEYKAELWDLAQAGEGRARQIRYALHQLIRIVAIGRVLRSPQRRSVAL